MLKINLRNEDLSLCYTFKSKELCFENLETFFMKKMKILSEWKILFYDDDEHLIYNNFEILRGEKEYNITILKHKLFQDKIEEKNSLPYLIKNVTRAKNEIIVRKNNTIKSQYYKSDTTIDTSNFINFLNYSSSLFLSRSDVEMLNSFGNQYYDIMPDENLLENLLELGFSLPRARFALIISRNDIIKAAELLCNPNYEEIFNIAVNNRQVIFNLNFEN
jgi:hypothetical protein